MAISVFDLYSIGIGPSSSHTVGPMRAARLFVQELDAESLISSTTQVVTDLYGSLALTGKGHATDKAIILGLMGYTPAGVDPDEADQFVEKARVAKTMSLFGKQTIEFEEDRDLLFHMDKQLPYHPNGIRFSAFNSKNTLILERVYYSVGGGFVVPHAQANAEVVIGDTQHSLPYLFRTGAELLDYCSKNHLSIRDLVMENEKTWRTEEEIRQGILNIWHVMKACIERGCSQEGTLPGGLNVRRRAAKMLRDLEEKKARGVYLPAELMEWVSIWALAVNEENAAGGRVVTAPTNGSAGVIPAVIQYYIHFYPHAKDDDIITFFLVSAAIGILFKEGASISAAEMGCMGEVGVACSMAAAGLTAVLGGTNAQIENAAEIGMEHNLGLTCDPVLGLVQIPCIERNTMGAIKGINAAQLALAGDGLQRVSLDQVIATMRETGNDMRMKYKETSQGGLAVNVIEC